MSQANNRMDASDIIRKKHAQVLAKIQKDPAQTVASGQVPNNPPLTPGQNAEIISQYPPSEFANTNNIYPSGYTIGTDGRKTYANNVGIICSTIYTPQNYY